MASVRGVLACLLKTFNFILAVLGVLMIVYSLWMLKEWASQSGGGSSSSSSPPPPDSLRLAQAPPALDSSALSASALAYPELAAQLPQMPPFLLAKMDGMVTGDKLAAVSVPWFIYAFLAAGIFICIVSLSGAIAAEIHNAFCLSCYQFGIAFMLLVQVVIAAGLFLDKSWDEDLPDDPSGELERMKEFIAANIGILKWLGLAVLLVQIIAIVLAMILRAMNDDPGRSRKEDEEAQRQAARTPLSEPLLIQPGSIVQPISQTRLADAQRDVQQQIEEEQQQEQQQQR